jgi:hypothetical protein
MSELPADGAAAPADANVIDTAPPPVGAEAAPAAETPEPSLDDTIRDAWAKTRVNGADRGEDGKFVGKEAEATPEPAAPDTPAIEPPNSWTAEAKTNWAKLPRETQDYILQRESEAQKALTTNGQRIKNFEPLERAVAQHQAYLDRRGIKPEQAFDFLLRAQMHFDQDPLGAATAILRSYGVDLPAMLSGQQAQAPDINSQMLQRRLDNIEGAIHQQQQQAAQQLQRLEQEQMADAEAQLTEFRKDKPHFEDVRGIMGLLMREGKADTLDRAYDMATNAIPEIRQRIQADQRKAEEAKRAEETAKKAADAQKAARLNVRSSTAAQPNPESIDDTLQKIARRHYG